MGAWGEGSLREKRPGVFEIRIAVGVDPVSGLTVQRSFWFHGALEDAEERRRELAAQFAEYRAVRRAAPFLTVGELLERWTAAHHDWRPSIWVGVRSNVKALSADPIAGRRVATLRPEVVRVTMARWREAGAGVSVVSGRFRVLRSAVGWAQSESIIDRNPSGTCGVRHDREPACTSRNRMSWRCSECRRCWWRRPTRPLTVRCARGNHSTRPNRSDC